LSVDNSTIIIAQRKLGEDITRKHRLHKAFFASAGFLDLTNPWAKDLNGVDFCENRGCDMLSLGLRAQAKPFERIGGTGAIRLSRHII